MSDFNDRYKRAAGMRMGAMPAQIPGAMAPQSYGPAPASYGNSWPQLLEMLGFGAKPQQQQSVTVPAKPPSLPPFEQPGASGSYMPPMNLPRLPQQDRKSTRLNSSHT